MLLKLGFCLLCLFAVSSCRQTPATSQDSEVQITVEIQPSPPKVGEAVFIVTLRTEAELPINDADLQVRGDMTHAGMTPEFGVVEPIGDGRYRVLFQWTMRGDWIIMLTATINDDVIARQQFEYVVEE